MKFSQPKDLQQLQVWCEQLVGELAALIERPSRTPSSNNAPARSPSGRHFSAGSSTSGPSLADGQSQSPSRDLIDTQSVSRRPSQPSFDTAAIQAKKREESRRAYLKSNYPDILREAWEYAVTFGAGELIPRLRAATDSKEASLSESVELLGELAHWCRIQQEQKTRSFGTWLAKLFGRTHGGAQPPSAITTHNYTGCAFGERARVAADSINSSHDGDVAVGDKITIGGNVTGSAVGTNASLKARDIVTQIQQSGILGEDLRQAFAKAAEELATVNIPEGDREDTADDMKKLKDELEKPAKDEGRIQKIWNRIKGAAPTVASILASAASIGKIVGVTP